MNKLKFKFSTIKFANALFVSSVCVIIIFVTINNIFGIISDIPSTEKRVLASCPDLKRPKDQKIIDFLKTFPKTFPNQFESCFKDNFSLRNLIVLGVNYSRLMIFDKSPTTTVAKGKEGWYYNVDPTVVSAYNGSNTYSSDDLNKWVTTFKNRSELLKSKNIQYILAIVPNKMTVYPEYLPEKYKSKTTPTRLDQLNDRLTKQKDFKYINIKPDLLEVKKNTNAFYKLDSHWSQESIIELYEKIEQSFNSTLMYRPTSRKDYTIIQKDRIGDMPFLMGTSKFMPEKVVQFTPSFSDVGVNTSPYYNLQKSNQFGVEKLFPDYEYKNETLKNTDSAVIFGDSYTDELRPFLANSFSELNFLKTAEAFDESYIDLHKPKVVIQVFNESNLVQ